ncbi:YidB family protein [Streptomyces blattellae]|uniref:YidB family protein n=1 Tax=Streptomyces blattellae TaxID=2569855 RepID=UPI0012B83A1D|nr:YidB family protein [Streptomyces blattellae]
MAGNDLGSLLGGLLGGGQSGGTGGNMLGSLLSALTQNGQGASGDALGGLLDMLTTAGLAEQKASWVGTGENQSVTGAQIREALPDETLKQVADEAGVTPDVAATELAQVLPTAVDKLTPNGQIPTGSLEDLIKRQQL